MSASPQELVLELQRQHFADRRLTRSTIHVAEDAQAVRVQGQVLDRRDADTLLATLRQHAPAIAWQDELVPLVAGPEYGWAMLNRAVSDLRLEPTNKAERVSQVVFGEAVEILERRDGWWFVRLPDGYLGWVAAEALHETTQAAAESWQAEATHIVTHSLLPVYADLSGSGEQQYMLLPFGSRVVVTNEDGRWSTLRMPNGMRLWAPTFGLLPLNERPDASPAGLREVVEWLYPMVGVPYLWGGRTPFGYDCSGVVQAVYALLDMPLLRDADQQYTQGRAVARNEMLWGDLLFFDTSLIETELANDSDRYITHVALALDDDDFLHASSQYGGLVRGSLNPASPFFTPSYEQRLIGTRRMVDEYNGG